MRPSRRDGISAKVIGMGRNAVQNVGLMRPMQSSAMDQFIELRMLRRFGYFLE